MKSGWTFVFIAGILFIGVVAGAYLTTPTTPPPVTREQYDAAMSQTAQLQADLNTERQKSETLTAQRYEAERRAERLRSGATKPSFMRPD